MNHPEGLTCHRGKKEGECDGEEGRLIAVKYGPE